MKQTDMEKNFAQRGLKALQDCASPHDMEEFEHGEINIGPQYKRRACRGKTSGDVWIWEASMLEWFQLWPPCAHYFKASPAIEKEWLAAFEALAKTAPHKCPKCSFNNTEHGLKITKGRCVMCLEVLPLN
jgi:hypothetical protein